MAMAEIVAIWVGAVLMLFALSFVFKSTLLFRIAEHTFLGCASGHMVVMSVNVIRSSAITPLAGGAFALIIPIILGILLFTRLVPKISWMSRWPTALLLGVGSGLTFRSAVVAQLIKQVKPTITSVVVAGNAAETLGRIVVLVGVISTLWYFVFTVEKTGIKGKISTLGRWIMMAAFGAHFGSALMGRITLVANALFFLLSDWLGIIH